MNGISMGLAHYKQNFLDQVTQQWVILFGRKIDPVEYDWLTGPFGSTRGIGFEFIRQLAEKEQLVVERHQKDKVLIESFVRLNLSEKELKALSQEIIDFYEQTAAYELKVRIEWTPVFKVLGRLLKILFSSRIKQLNIPIGKNEDAEAFDSEIIRLLDPDTREVRRTMWMRSSKLTGEIVYSGVYEINRIPSGKTCIKAVFPLPHGNATVILLPRVGARGELILTSSGEKFGESGFYFLLNDKKGKVWARYIRSFKENLIAVSKNDHILLQQTLTLWNLKVLEFEYDIRKTRS